MKNIAFVLWMLFYPLIVELVNYLQFQISIEISEQLGFVNVIIWIFVGFLLFEKNKYSKEVNDENDK